MAEKAASTWLSYLVDRPGHAYWNSRTLDAKDFIYSFVSKYLPIYEADKVEINDSAGQFITPAMFAAGYVFSANTGTQTYTITAAANLISTYLTRDDDSLECILVNQSGANAITLAPGSGITIYGNLTVAAGKVVRIRVRRASSTTVHAFIL